MIDANIPSLKPSYRNIFIIDSLAQWELVKNKYEIKKDLVLTFDLGLQKKLSMLNAEVYFVDHLVGQERMQKNHFLIYDFFSNWHKNNNEEDLFVFENVPFGRSFRMDFWSDYTSYIRLYLCLNELVTIQNNNLYVVSKNDLVSDILKDLELPFNYVKNDNFSDSGFYFPIAAFMDSKIRPNGFRTLLHFTRRLLSNTYGNLMQLKDKVYRTTEIKTIFIQEYHPTRALLEKFRDEGTFRVLLCNFSRGSKIVSNLKERLLPISGSITKYEKVTQQLFLNYKNERTKSLKLDDGTDITKFVNQIIEKRIIKGLPTKLRILDNIIHYLNNNTVSLSVLIANIGQEATLFDCVCETRDIPSYLIINGMLGTDYSDESKYATVINGYSECMKENYFVGMDNVITLGDPRMDMYPALAEPRKINRKNPTIVIGASGYSAMDLNSYVALEFDFMFDVLSSLQRVKNQGVDINVIIKVRPNGYEHQYKCFTEQYFPNLVSEVISSTPMRAVLAKSDLYISINSQTLFEASCLGIPVIYYKNDNEILHPPFNNKCELVTVTSTAQLIEIFNDFQNNSSIFDDFLKRDVMEKYIGPLDGNNLTRNAEFITNFLKAEGAKND